MSSVPRSKKYESALFRKGLYNTHLNDLTLLVKSLYPHREVVNPFEKKVEQQDWYPSQKRLILSLMKALTLLNLKYRTEDKYGRFVCNKEDFVNAIALLDRELKAVKPAILLNAQERWFFNRLWMAFGSERFTAKQAQTLCELGKTTVWWKLQELQRKGFVELDGSKKQAYLYRIVRWID